MKDIVFTNEINKQDIEELKNLGYKYYVKAKDNLLSGWCQAENRKHIQIILCKNMEDVYKIIYYFNKDKTFSYVNYNYLEYKNIYNCTHGKSFTIRNKWRGLINIDK